ncbi:hypothetical protein GCM10011416_05220 [Polaribacter pacificus]|uniref:Alanine racemase n=1 Tax=Polaribacter pacificus TaxID=1775173 RepID=A0A917MBD3_9FLAO|nr:alanine racemase [Polaribacter pacificus]GGG91515.1 hypothetical protein GCM10011416_05220 [Polaribacter pacificus]
MNNHVTVLEIDKSALRYNLSFFKHKLLPTTKILVVVKAFGYGSDAVKIAGSIEKEVDYFAVAYTDEGINLRESGITKPILILHPQIQNLKKVQEYQLEPNLYNFKIFDAFVALCKQQNLTKYPIHLKFNTGLNRIGFWHTDIPVLLSKIKETASLKITSIFSHLAASEDLQEKEFTKNQINDFKSIAKQLKENLTDSPFLHLLNTSGIINYPEAQFDMVRLGIGLYGFANDTETTRQLKNVLTLKSVISQIHLIEPDESVGYNRAYIATKPMRTATIPIGHADGFPRTFGNGVGGIYINKEYAPVVGNVCMDMIMVDVTHIECNEGDEIVVFDSQEKLEELAQKTNTISYELLTNLSPRIKRLLKC